MKINAEFDQRVVVHSTKQDWITSPMAGVDRRPLDRVGGEVARATTIVRYAPGSSFSPHVHTGGEEFVVLEGVFSDEHGDFPVGSYIRNPPQSSHTPGSEPGCVIFVKLWQFESEDRTHIRLRTDHMTPVARGDFPGVKTIPLYTDDLEDVAMHYLDAQAELKIDASKAAEVLVLDGEISEGADVLQQFSWLRTPLGTQLHLKAGAEGARIWVKTGNLEQVEAQINRVNAV